MNTPHYHFVRTSYQVILSRLKKHKKHLVWMSIIGAIIFSSCVSVPRAVLNPPKIAGADFVGMNECSLCHEDLVKNFEWATHSKVMSHGDESLHLGCEACHGPGSLHAESGGMPNTIVNPVNSSESCMQCHLDTKGSFNLPYGHDVHNGSMNCTDCHDPHSGNAISGGGMSLASSAQTCTECHKAQGNHYVFRHEATQDGCTVCHSPHGSVNNKMLKSSNASLCLQCHFQQQTAAGEIMIGGRNHASFLPRGTCWTAGCHEAIHGSNISSSLRY